MKKLLCLLLVVLTVSSAFLVACGGDATGNATTDPGNTPETQVTEDTSAIYDAEVKDLKGKNFHFLARYSASKHLSSFDIYAEGNNGDKINDAVFKRNAQLQSVYNCTITMDTDADIIKNYRDTLIAGEYVADFIFTHIADMYQLAKSNLLVDFCTLESLDMSKDWWSQHCINSFSLGGRSFYMSGDGTTLDERATWVMYFNPDIINKHQLQSPYELVKSGDWTVEKFFEYMSACSEDLTGDGLIQFDKDVVGYMGENFNNYVHVAACGVTMYEKNADGTLSIPFSPKRELLDAWEALRNIITSPNRQVVAYGSIYKKNLVAFYGVNIAGVFNFADSEVSIGFLPFPKLNKAQEQYLTAPSRYQYGVYSIPQSVENDHDETWKEAGFLSAAERSAYFLEAFFYYSRSTLDPAYYNQVLLKQQVQDPESIEILRMVLDKDNIILDPVALFNFGLIGTSLFQSVGSPDGNGKPGSDSAYDTLVSQYGSRLTSAQEALAEYYVIIEATAPLT